MKFSLFSAVLFSIGWMSFVASDEERDLPGTCCLTVSETRVPVENIVKYEMQKPSTICSLRAVIFYTKRGIAICSDPDSKYAKRVMKIVDGRTTAKPTMCYTSTTNTIPAVTTTNETPGKKTETSTKNWVQDYIQTSNKRKTTEETDQREFAKNGGLESFTESIHVTTTTIPVKYILKNLRSHSKKGLRKFQAGVWQRMQKSSVAEE